MLRTTRGHDPIAETMETCHDPLRGWAVAPIESKGASTARLLAVYRVDVGCSMVLCDDTTFSAGG